MWAAFLMNIDGVPERIAEALAHPHSNPLPGREGKSEETLSPLGKVRGEGK